MTRPNINGWGKVLATLLPLLIAGLIAYGRLTAQAETLREQVGEKASRETVTTQYNEILRRLEAIDRRLERLELDKRVTTR